MKKRVFALAVVAICLSVLASASLAYFTDANIARNVITSGNIDIYIVEQQMEDGVLKPYENPAIPVMPGTTVSKIVSVENAGLPAWIRTCYTVTVYDAEKKKIELSAEQLKKMIMISPDTSFWTYKDGWWYHNTSLESGEMTKPLFEKVEFSGPDMDNKYQHCTVIIDVIAQGVQRANNGFAVLEAMGWPEY